MDASGNFVITWMSNGQDGSGQGVYAQRYYPSGATQGTPFRVNDTTSGNQQYQAAALAPTGIWSSPGAAMGWKRTGVFDKVYAFPAAVVVFPASGLTTTVSGGTASFSIALAVPPTANVTVPLSLSDSNQATLSANSVTFTPANWYVPRLSQSRANDLVADGSDAIPSSPPPRAVPRRTTMVSTRRIYPWSPWIRRTLP